ncbi:MAG: serine hydrolase [Myxococcales bacterium]|nr:serine hydrolase [Myxococcales bacterium]
MRFSVVALLFNCLCGGCSSGQSESAMVGAEWATAPPEEQGFDSAVLAEVIEQIGIAVDRGLLTLDQRLLASFPDLAPAPTLDGKPDIDLSHLLTMASGLDRGRSPGEPELFEMVGSDHYVRYALELPMAVAPGTEWAYCSPGSHLMSAMIANAAETSTLEFAEETLFGPLGITDVTWPADPQGVNYGWGDLQLHPRDMAKIGELFLNDGAWNGSQIVAKGWVGQASQSLVLTDDGGTGYGYQRPPRSRALQLASSGNGRNPPCSRCNTTRRAARTIFESAAISELVPNASSCSSQIRVSTSFRRPFGARRSPAAIEASGFTRELRIADIYVDDTNGRTIIKSWAKEKRPRPPSSRKHSSW